MKREKISARTIQFYISESDFQRLETAWKGTTYRSRSQYMRKMILRKPIVVHSRNRSLDDFIEMAVKLRKDLTQLKDLPSLTLTEKEELTEKIDQIHARLIIVADSCLQK